MTDALGKSNAALLASESNVMMASSSDALAASTSSPGKVKHGRRALREGEHSDVPLVRDGWGEQAEKKPLYAAPKQTASFAPIDAATEAQLQQNAAAQLQAHEQLVAEVARAPTEYHSAMPKQSELERATAAKFQSLLQQAAHDGVDLQCLMATLTGQFDDADVAWEPAGLLMHLTSEINDRAAADDEEALGVEQVQEQQQQQQHAPAAAGGAQSSQQAADGGAARSRTRDQSAVDASQDGAPADAGPAPAHGRRQKK